MGVVHWIVFMVMIVGFLLTVCGLDWDVKFGSIYINIGIVGVLILVAVSLFVIGEVTYEYFVQP